MRLAWRHVAFRANLLISLLPLPCVYKLKERNESVIRWLLGWVAETASVVARLAKMKIFTNEINSCDREMQ